MKMAFIIHNEHYAKNVLELLKQNDIDYFTRWDHVVGKGHGTEPHLGLGTYASTNAVLMIAFREEAPLNALVAAIESANAAIARKPDHIRLFQLPLDRIV